MIAGSIQIACDETADLPGILALFADTINQVCAKDYSARQRAAWTASIKDTKRWIKKLENQHFLFALFKETYVGFASMENGIFPTLK